MGLEITLPAAPAKKLDKPLIFQRFFSFKLPQNSAFLVFYSSVTHGCDTMTLKYNHLERRKHTFYFRYRVPSWVRHIIQKNDFRYSLNTNDYNIAIHLVKRETFKYDNRYVLYFNNRKTDYWEFNMNKDIIFNPFKLFIRLN